AEIGFAEPGTRNPVTLNGPGLLGLSRRTFERFLSLLRARASQDVRQRVIAFVAGVLEDRAGGLCHRNRNRPRPRIRGGILYRVAVIDDARIDAGEPFHDVQARARRTAAVERVEDDVVVEV